MNIMQKQKRMEIHGHLQLMLDDFKNKSKDYVFLVNEDLKQSYY